MAANRDRRDGAAPGFAPLDVHFARLMEEFAGAESPELRLAAALVSRAVSGGHVCLDLRDVAGLPGEGGAPLWEAGTPYPDLAPWCRALGESPVVGEPGAFTPLVLDPAGRLYLHRYWAYEDRLARYLEERAAVVTPVGDPVGLRAGLDRLFGPVEVGADPDGQRVAAAVAACRPFCVISGGPGTGKTTTVVKILALLAGLDPTNPPRMALAAPTGKAASRLKESVRAAKASLPVEPDTAAVIPDDVSTVHRLLGTVLGTPRFRHHRDNPLPHDVVVVDEASMVDLPLMAKLVDALRPEAKLILLGDKDQLASVQAGAVLGDICGGAGVERFSPRMAGLVGDLAGGGPEALAGGAEGLGDAIVLLQKNYRFGAASGIGRVSRLVNAGDGEAALEVLRDPGVDDVRWVDVPAPEGLATALKEPVLAGYREVVTAADPEAAHAAFARFQILCALRSSPYGVEAVNQVAEGVLAAAGWIDPRGTWYAGRPVLVTQNDYHVGLFNGDVGITLSDPDAEGRLMVYFPAPDGSMRRIVPTRVPPHETCYAMTVHKSQGSEFDAVLLLLGAYPSRVLTRELVYTGITRARSRAAVWATPSVFAGAVGERLRRNSGLRDVLWGP